MLKLKLANSFNFIDITIVYGTLTVIVIKKIKSTMISLILLNVITADVILKL